MGDELGQRALTALRNQRHGFINHLQVVSGWLQLNRPERAKTYLDALAIRMASESESMRRLPVMMGLVLVLLCQEAESLNVQIDWQLTEPVLAAADTQAGQLYEQVSDMIRNTACRPEGQRRLRVSVGEYGDFAVHTFGSSSAG